MKRSFVWFGCLCAMFATSAVGHAFGLEGAANIDAKKNAQLKGVISNRVKYQPPAPLLLAQSSADNAVRVNEMQEQVRRLNGKVEELTFQLLQLQEQIRKMQEDNEYRFQELEEKRSDASGAVKKPDSTAAVAPAGEGRRLGKPQPSEVEGQATPSDGKITNKTIREAGRILGTPPRSLGTLKFDANGNVIESAVGKPLDLTSLRDPTLNSSNTDGGSDLSNIRPGMLLARGRDFYDAGDYVLAERSLRSVVETYPEDRNRAEAQYWLGRSLFARRKFHAAATIFLDTHNTYPKAQHAPDTLLQLGLAMAGLNHREIACATYAEVLKQYPKADKKIKKQVSVERTSAKC